MLVEMFGGFGAATDITTTARDGIQNESGERVLSSSPFPSLGSFGKISHPHLFIECGQRLEPDRSPLCDCTHAEAGHSSKKFVLARLLLLLPDDALFTLPPHRPALLPILFWLHTTCPDGSFPFAVAIPSTATGSQWMLIEASFFSVLQVSSLIYSYSWWSQW